jgi:hypothetical protein
MKSARKHEATVVGFVRSMDLPCPTCGKTVNINDLAGGKYDVGGVGGCLVLIAAAVSALGGALLLLIVLLL